MDAERIRQSKDLQLERNQGRPLPQVTFQERVVGVTFVPGYPEIFHELLLLGDVATARGERLTALLIRDPKNPFDCNAIQVHIPALGDQAMIGHISKVTAARLAPDLDSGALWQAELYSINISLNHEDRPGAVLEIHPVQGEQQNA